LIINVHLLAAIMEANFYLLPFCRKLGTNSIPESAKEGR
jgi:hypothetical protein